MAGSGSIARDGRLVALGLAGIVFLAFCVRGAAYPTAIGEDRVSFVAADSQYHLRRAYFGFRNYPSVLTRDSYINFPGGASIPWPPLYDVVLASAAALWAEDDRGFERVVAWANPVIGALACIPIFLVGRRLRSARLGLGAAAIFALLPVNVLYARVGDADHHALVAMLGAWVLALGMAIVDPRDPRDAERRARPRWALAFALAAVRAALMTTWHGSLLYLVVGDGVLLAAGALTGRRVIFATECVSLVATALLIAPVLAWLPEPLGGAYSSISLSRLHAIALWAAAFAAASMVAISPRVRAPWTRFACIVGLGALPVACALLLPGVRAGLEPALRFLTMTDAVGVRTLEQLPILALERRAALDPFLPFGLLVFAFPVAPVVLAWQVRAWSESLRPLGWALAAWTGIFTALALGQYRYANDLGPGVAVVFALGISWACGWAARRVPVLDRVGPWLAVLLGLVLFAPPIATLYAPWARNVAADLVRGAPRPLDKRNTALLRMLDTVRRVTPETSGYLDPESEPEYGIAAHADLGHAIQYLARRPTATDPFWSYIGEENWEDSWALLSSGDEPTAIALAERLRARYVLTAGRSQPGELAHHLHLRDGRSDTERGVRPALSHFRLIAEAPIGSAGMASGRHGRGGVPFKLFEIVAGATLEVEASPGELVRARTVVASAQREFPFEVRARAGADGVAHLVVPYDTEPGGEREVWAREPYRVRRSGGVTAVSVAEVDVLEGRSVRVRSGAFAPSRP